MPGLGVTTVQPEGAGLASALERWADEAAGSRSGTAHWLRAH